MGDTVNEEDHRRKRKSPHCLGRLVILFCNFALWPSRGRIDSLQLNSQERCMKKETISRDLLNLHTIKLILAPGGITEKPHSLKTFFPLIFIDGTDFSICKRSFWNSEILNYDVSLTYGRKWVCYSTIMSLYFKENIYFLFCDWDSAYSQGLVFTKAHFTLWICGWECTFIGADCLRGFSLESQKWKWELHIMMEWVIVSRGRNHWPPLVGSQTDSLNVVRSPAALNGWELLSLRYSILFENQRMCWAENLSPNN